MIKIGIKIYNPFIYLELFVTGEELNRRLIGLGLEPVYHYKGAIEYEDLIAEVLKCAIIITDKKQVGRGVVDFVDDVLKHGSIQVMDRAMFMNGIEV